MGEARTRRELEVVMVCTQARGGMRAVVEGYLASGLARRWRIRVLWSHREGSLFVRLAAAASTGCELLCLLLGRRVGFAHIHAAMRGSFWRKSMYAALCRAVGVPVILHLHGSEMKNFYDGLSPWARALATRQLERAACVVVLSESWLRYVKEIAPGARICVVHNYVALPQLPPPKQAQDSFSVLFLGLLGPRKGIFDLLASWKMVVAAIPSARLLVGGNGQEQQARDLANTLGLGNSVEFLGWVGAEAKAALLGSADAFVLPSHNEGLPMSVLEAMSYGLPVISTRVGGIPELITEGKDGVLIESGDQTALASALIALGRFPSLRDGLGAAARVRVEQSFSAEAVLPVLEALYQGLSPGVAPAVFSQ